MYESDGTDDSRSKATLTLTRGPGVYGLVSVDYIIMASDGSLVTDLTPTTGTVTISSGQVGGMNYYRLLQYKLDCLVCLLFLPYIQIW